jgi:hypothetical protein
MHRRDAHRVGEPDRYRGDRRPPPPQEYRHLAETAGVSPDPRRCLWGRGAPEASNAS